MLKQRRHRGRNVCLHYLMGTCKFGDLKCIYSHSKEFLPKDGWWTTENGIRNVRDGLEFQNRREIKVSNSSSGPSNFGHVPRGMSGLLGQFVWQCGTFTQRVHAAGAPALTSFNNIHTHFLAALRSGRMSLRRQMTSLFRRSLVRISQQST